MGVETLAIGRFDFLSVPIDLNGGAGEAVASAQEMVEHGFQDFSDLVVLDSDGSAEPDCACVDGELSVLQGCPAVGGNALVGAVGAVVFHFPFVSLLLVGLDHFGIVAVEFVKRLEDLCEFGIFLDVFPGHPCFQAGSAF